MALTPRDRELLRRCLHHEAGSWNEFVDRFLGLVYHVIQHTSHLRSVPLSSNDADDIAAQILLQIVENDYAVLRQFRGKSSLATYLTVVSRRVCLKEMMRRSGQARESAPLNHDVEDEAPPTTQERLEQREEVGKLLRKLPEKDRAVVRLFFLEGMTYKQISDELEVPVSSIGPILSRAKKRLRSEENGQDEAHA